MKTRKVERKRTEINGQCCTNQGRLFDITVCDLSDGGCRFRDADNSLFVGVAVSIMINGTGPHRCYVRWREGVQVGVSFVRPLSPAQLDELLYGRPIAAAPATMPSPVEEDEAANAPAPLRRFC